MWQKSVKNQNSRGVILGKNVVKWASGAFFNNWIDINVGEEENQCQITPIRYPRWSLQIIWSCLFLFWKKWFTIMWRNNEKNEKLKYFKDRIYSILTCKKIFAGRKNLWSDIIRSCVLSGQFSSEICQTKPMESDWHTMLYQIQLPGNCSYISKI